MDLESSIRLVVLIISVLLSLAIILYAVFRGKKRPELRIFMLLQVLFIIWFTGQIMRLFAPDYRTEWIFVRYEYFAIIFLGFTWLWFCLLYTESKFLARRYWLFLLIIPVFSYIAILTNDLHHQFFRISDTAFNNFGLLFYIHMIESYVYLISGIILLFIYAYQQLGYKKIQTILLIIAGLLPLGVNYLLVIGVIHTNYDCTPFSIMISLLIYLFATFKYKLLNILPIALREIVDNMNEAILVVDNLNRVVEYNRSFILMFPELKNCIDKDIRVFMDIVSSRINEGDIEKLKRSIENKQEAEYKIEIGFSEPDPKTYRINIRPLLVGKEILGRVISINDITEYRELLEALNVKNIELSIINRQLKEYADTAEELAITKERNRFARDVHDTLGQTMTLLITLLQLSSSICRKSPETAEIRINEAIKIAEKGLAEVRQSIIGLTPCKTEMTNIVDSLKSLIQDFQPSGLQISLTVRGDDQTVNPILYDIIYRLCQEALTNSLRHGKAQNVSIVLEFLDSKIKIEIFDDGSGCHDIEKGFGLSGMEQRVRSAHGQIFFGSQKNEGFGILVELPR